MYMCMHMYMYMYMYMYMCMHMCMYMCICMCMYVYLAPLPRSLLQCPPNQRFEHILRIHRTHRRCTCCGWIRTCATRFPLGVVPLRDNS